MTAQDHLDRVRELLAQARAVAAQYRDAEPQAPVHMLLWALDCACERANDCQAYLSKRGQ